MIRIHGPAIDPSDLKGETRVGACVFVEDDDYILCIDGRFGTAADRVVKRLDGRKKKKYLFLTHPHGDHAIGIEKEIDKNDDVAWLICQDPASFNKNYSDEAKGNVAMLERIIAKAKKKGIKVVYAKNGERFHIGSIEFVTYRDQPSSARNTETYINQGSLCVWFPQLRLLYTGDTGADCAEKYKLSPVVATGFHHGNWLAYQHAVNLKKRGCLYYWDDDYSTKMTDFLMTGRRNAKRAGMTIFDLHGDLNIVAFNNKAILYKGGKLYRYECSYARSGSFKATTLTVVYDVLLGKYGSGDSRTTKLLDEGFNPGSVQGWVNKFAGVFK